MFSITAQAGGKKPSEILAKDNAASSCHRRAFHSRGDGERWKAHFSLSDLQHHFEVTYKAESLFDDHLSLCHPMLFYNRAVKNHVFSLPFFYKKG